MDRESHPLIALIRSRVSEERYADRPVPDEIVRELVADAAHAPSSFNIQHWRFVAVIEDEDRARLRRAAFDQPQVTAAPLVYILLGDVAGTDRLPEIMQLAVERGSLPSGRAEAWVRLASRIYADPALARDESIRSVSLAAMLLMLSAQARGLVSGAISGFDPGAVRREFEIADRLLPVMLITVGYPVEPRSEPKPRLDVERVLAFGSGRDL